MRVAKIGFWISIFGFLVSEISLALGHPGVSLKIINLTFFVILFFGIYGVFIKSE